jgi:hypothetical protein
VVLKISVDGHLTTGGCGYKPARWCWYGVIIISGCMHQLCTLQHSTAQALFILHESLQDLFN